MSVDLVPEWTVGDLCLTSYPFGVDADSTVDIGEPEMVVEGVTSMLADGDIERVTRYGNRTYVLEIYVEGPSLADLASSEASLRTELRRTGLLLTHDPGDGFSPASVYEVQTAQLTPQRRDDHESHLVRKFTLSLTCSPWARSASLVTVPALETGTTTVVVDMCDSETGWSGRRNGVATVAEGPTTLWEAGAVGIMELSDTEGSPPETWELVRTGAIDMSATPFLSVEITTLSAKGGAPLEVAVYANGIRLPLLQSTTLTDGSGYFRLLLDSRATPSVSTLTFAHTSHPGYGHAWQGLSVRNIARTDIRPGITSRQTTRVVDVGGTERTPGSLHVQSPNGTDPLHMVIVHTYPEDGSGYAPPLRRWRVSGQGPTLAPEPMSGAFEPITGLGITYDIPTSTLPEGGYVLVARLSRSEPGDVTIAWSTSTLRPGSSTPEGFTAGYETVSIPGDIWYVRGLAALTLPSVRTKAGTVRVILQDPSTDGPTTYVDEAWLFRVDDDCALTMAETPYAHLWLNSAGVDGPAATVWTGDQIFTRAHPGAGLLAMGAHVLSPEGTTVFTASVMSDPEVDATFYRRWHSNAAE